MRSKAVENVSLEKRIIRFLMENITEPQLNVNSIAKELKKNRSYIFRIVIKQCNCSPQRLIETKRITLALELLSKGEKVIYTAIKTGFVNGYNLRRAFKKRLGITPSDFKEKCCKAENIEDVLNDFKRILK